MPIIPWKPFADMDRFFDDDTWFLPLIPRFNEPAMDVYEIGQNVMAKISLPGFDPEKINVSVKDQVLRVSGSSEEKTEKNEKGYWRREIKQGSFDRAVRLPVAVEEDAVEATYDKGVLEIVMPKAKHKQLAAKNVKIKIKKS